MAWRGRGVARAKGPFLVVSYPLVSIIIHGAPVICRQGVFLWAAHGAAGILIVFQQGTPSQGRALPSVPVPPCRTSIKFIPQMAPFSESPLLRGASCASICIHRGKSLFVPTAALGPANSCGNDPWPACAGVGPRDGSLH